MSVLLMMPGRDTEELQVCLNREYPELEVEVWPNIKDKDRVEHAVCWNHKHGSINELRNVKVITSYGAGVDHVLKDRSLPMQIPINRIIDNDIKVEMLEYILSAILFYQRGAKKYAVDQSNKDWLPVAKRPVKETLIGVLGLGQIGGFVASKLSELGYNVSGFSKTPSSLEGVRVYSGNEIEEFLAGLDYLVCLLPLTPETKGYLDKSIFSKLKSSCYILNASRGEVLNDMDLKTALDSKDISGAALDVFTEEPLPKNHFFWNMDQIQITPHVASMTNPNSAAMQIYDTNQKLTMGHEIENLIDRGRGY